MEELLEKIHTTFQKIINVVNEIVQIIKQRFNEIVNICAEYDIELTPRCKHRIVRDIFVNYYYIPHFKKNMPYCRRCY